MPIQFLHDWITNQYEQKMGWRRSLNLTADAVYALFLVSGRWTKQPCRLIRMDTLSLFGLFAVTAMMACYALEHKSRWFVLGFALSCGLGSVYGFLQGAWPFGVVEAVWMFVAVHRWMTYKSN